MVDFSQQLDIKKGMDSGHDILSKLESLKKAIKTAMASRDDKNDLDIYTLLNHYIQQQEKAIRSHIFYLEERFQLIGGKFTVPQEPEYKGFHTLHIAP